LQTYFKFLYFITVLQTFLGVAYLKYIFLNSRVKYVGVCVCVCVTCLVNCVLGLPVSPEEEEGSLLQKRSTFFERFYDNGRSSDTCCRYYARYVVVLDSTRIPIKIHVTYNFQKNNSRDPGVRSQARQISSSKNIHISYEPTKLPTELVPAFLHNGKG
jgi:hypothetical protein